MLMVYGTSVDHIFLEYDVTISVKCFSLNEKISLEVLHFQFVFRDVLLFNE